MLLIKTPKGKALTGRKYVALVRAQQARDQAHPCMNGHFDCAAWENGPCLAAIEANTADSTPVRNDG